MRQSLESALRRFYRHPGFTARIVIIFVLGMGANAIMFSAVDRLMLSPPEHVEAPDGIRRVVVWRSDAGSGPATPGGTASYPMLSDLASVAGVGSVAAYAPYREILGWQQEGRSVQVLRVTGEYFRLLGTPVQRGRPLLPADDRAGAEAAAVISHGLWQRDFGGADVLGRPLDLGGRTHVIVGVGPHGFTGVDHDPVDVWVPLMVSTSGLDFILPNRRFDWLRLITRLEDGADPMAVATRATETHRRAEEAAGFGARTGAAPREATQARIDLAPLIAARGPLASGESRVAGWLFAVSLLVLLIACANVANLLLSRAVRQQGDTGIRLALGVSRGRLIRESFLDGLLPAVAGALAALVLAEWVGPAVHSLLIPGGLPPARIVDARLAGFLLGLTILAGAASGALPALHSAGRDVRGLLGSTARSGTGRGRARGALAVVQTALSLVLLVGATLFLRSLQQVGATDLGFQAERLLLARPVLDGGWADPAERRRFFDEAAATIAGHPGVESVGYAGMTAPFSNQMFLDLADVDGGHAANPDARRVFVTLASPGYFETLGARMAAGRPLAASDRAGSDPVAVINETMAGSLWPGEPPLGRCFRLEGGDDAEPPCIRVVGVVEDLFRRGLDESPAMHAFLAADQDPVEWGGADILFVRAAGDPGVLAPAIRSAMTAALPRLRFAQVDPVTSLFDPLTRSWRIGAGLFTLFGALALVVAAFGLYSLLAFEVVGRRRELAIRSALGASGPRILRSVLARGLTLTFAGIGLGLLATVAAAPAAAELLYRTRPLEPGAVLAACAALVAAALLATVVPARHALAVAPARDLGAE